MSLQRSAEEKKGLELSVEGEQEELESQDPAARGRDGLLGVGGVLLEELQVGSRMGTGWGSVHRCP